MQKSQYYNNIITINLKCLRYKLLLKKLKPLRKVFFFLLLILTNKKFNFVHIKNNISFFFFNFSLHIFYNFFYFKKN